MRNMGLLLARYGKRSSAASDRSIEQNKSVKKAWLVCGQLASRINSKHSNFENPEPVLCVQVLKRSVSGKLIN